MAYAVGDSLRSRREPVRRTLPPPLRWDRITVLALNVGAWSVIWSAARYLVGR
jgi:hypothetical protein